MTDDRVLAAELHDVLENMLYMAIEGLQSAPRRETCRVKFMDVVEKILERQRAKRGS